MNSVPVEVTGDGPTETTSLLGGHPSVTTRPKPDQLPFVQPAVARLQTRSILSDISWCPETLEPAVKTSYILVVLLQLRKVLLERIMDPSSWEPWSTMDNTTSSLHNIDVQLSQAWTSFVQHATTNEITEALWLQFSLDENHDGIVLRVVDFLCKENAPEELLSHPVTLLCLMRVWKQGSVSSERVPDFTQRLLHKLDTLCTPRALHIIDLMFQLVYLAVLLHYILLPADRPPEAGHTTFDGRAPLLMIYSLSHLCRTWSITIIPYILTLLAFLLSFPLVPSAKDSGYSILLLSAPLHVLQLHYPRSPSIMFLLSFEQTLPLAVLIWHGVSRVFLPVIVFFFPALLLVLFLLSTSLSDTLFRVFLSLNVDPAPLEARTTFLILLALLFLLLICSLVILILVYPAVSSNTRPLSTWDRFSRPIGLEARQAFADIVVTYASPYYFPPPLNLISFILSDLPIYLTSMLRKMGAARKLGVLRIYLWRLTVAPLGLFAAGIWFWGLIDQLW